VVSVKEETTQQRKINGPHRTNWNLANIADFAEDTLCTKRLNKWFILVVDVMRAVYFEKGYSGQ
jgi:hypothetical protein